MRFGAEPVVPASIAATPIGPASIAATRQRAAASPPASDDRTFPCASDPHDATGDAVALAATRALLTVSSRAQAAAVLRTAIRDLGGRVVRARLAGPDAIPVDVSLGVGEPMVVTILDPVDVSSFRLARQLPALVEDALAAARRCDDGRRQSRRASMVALNGVATRAEIDSKLQGSIHGDVVCMLGLDDLQLLNDTAGHAAGDQALADLGDLLRGGVGADDFVARCGGDEFIAILAVTSLPVARERMTRLVADWAAGPGHRPRLSLGMAPVEEGGAFVASRAAAAALRRAREPGTGRMEIATPIDHLPDGSRP